MNTTVLGFNENTIRKAVYIVSTIIVMLAIPTVPRVSSPEFLSHVLLITALLIIIGINMVYSKYHGKLYAYNQKMFNITRKVLNIFNLAYAATLIILLIAAYITAIYLFQIKG